MIVGELNVVGVAVPPYEAYAPLEVALQCFEPIPRRHPQIFERARGIDLDEPSVRSQLSFSGQTDDKAPCERACGSPTPEFLNHGRKNNAPR